MTRETGKPKQREDGKVQEGEERNESLLNRAGRAVERNASLLRKLVGR